MGERFLARRLALAAARGRGRHSASGGGERGPASKKGAPRLALCPLGRRSEGAAPHTPARAAGAPARSAMSARLAKRQLALTLGDAPADAGGASGKVDKRKGRRRRRGGAGRGQERQSEPVLSAAAAAVAAADEAADAERAAPASAAAARRRNLKYLAPPKDSKQAKYHRKRTEGFVKRYEKVASARAKRMKPRADGDEEAEESEDDEEGDLFGAAGGSDEDGSDSDGDDGAAGVSGAMALFDKVRARRGARGRAPAGACASGAERPSRARAASD